MDNTVIGFTVKGFSKSQLLSIELASNLSCFGFAKGFHGNAIQADRRACKRERPHEL